MSGPPVKTTASGARTGDPKKIRGKKTRLRNGPGLYGTLKTYGGQAGGFKGGSGGGFGYMGSIMGGRAR